MTPQTETQLIAALQQIASQLGHINQKLTSLQSVNTHLSNLVARTGR
jgi:hypothetical protein